MALLVSSPKSCPIHLDPWQEEVLRQKGDLLLCTGRRVGKTYILSRKAIEHMVSSGKPIIVVSLTEDQAMLIIAMAIAYARQAHPEKIGKGRYKPTLKTITLMVNKKPVKLISRPVGNTGDATRGFEGGVLIVDEASRMPKMFWIAAKPILLTMAGEIWMCSTPFGKQGYFWERFNEAYNLKEPKARFKVFYISTEEVMNNRPISESWTAEQREGALRILDEDKREMSSLEYGQEYLGLFLEEIQRYYSDELIKKCCVIKRQGYKSDEEDYFLGVDIARMGEDEGTFEIIKRVGNKLAQIENIVTKKKLTTETENSIIALNRYYNFKKIYLDAGAGTLGVSIFDHLLKHEEVRRKIEAINNSVRVYDRDDKQKVRLLKEDLHDNLRSLMEKGDILLLDDESVKESLRSVHWSRETRDAGSPRVVIRGNYDHIAEGLIRAAWCIKAKGLNIWIKSIRI